MASYIESSLGRGERIVYKAQVSWFSQFWRIFFGILLLMWVIGIVFIVFAILNVMTTELALTNKRVIAKFGFIRRHKYQPYRKYFGKSRFLGQDFQLWLHSGQRNGRQSCSDSLYRPTNGVPSTIQ